MTIFVDEEKTIDNYTFAELQYHVIYFIICPVVYADLCRYA